MEVRKYLLWIFLRISQRYFFLKLELDDSSGKQVSSNFYWLSSNGDEKADFADLSKLPAANINATTSAIQQEGNKCKLTVTIENPGTGLAFGVNPKILKLTSKSRCSRFSGKIIISLCFQKKKECCMLSMT